MKSIIKNNYLTLFFCVIACVLVGCVDSVNEKENSEKEYQQIYDGLWRINHEGDDGYDIDQYKFFEDGVGLLLYLKKTPDSPYGYASSDYIRVFTYKIENDMLIFDYGFGYIQRYRLESISKETLYLSLNGYPFILKRSNAGLMRSLVPDYYMEIINTTWNIKDTEDKHQQYIISFYAGGTYESKSYSNVFSASFITETGQFEVQNSRVKFQSNTNGSLLDGRIFMITFANNSKTNGSIHLETENGTKITGYPQ